MSFVRTLYEDSLVISVSVIANILLETIREVIDQTCLSEIPEERKLENLTFTNVLLKEIFKVLNI